MPSGFLVMTVDQPPPSSGAGYWPTPDERARMIVDEAGTEWEVYDEAAWSIGIALEWDFLPQTENPGLIFVSRVDRRRLWPCPPNWEKLESAELVRLLAKAKSMV